MATEPVLPAECVCTSKPVEGQPHSPICAYRRRTLRRLSEEPMTGDQFFWHQQAASERALADRLAQVLMDVQNDALGSPYAIDDVLALWEDARRWQDVPDRREP